MSVRRSVRSIVLVVLVMSAVPLVGHAGTSVGAFEIDGNSTDEGGNSAIDWATPPANLVTFPDPDPATSACGGIDDSFGNGSKEDEPLTWDLICQGVSPKNEILSSQIATRQIGADTFLYINFTRADGGGNWTAAFEFNKVKTSFFNGNDNVQFRTNGDVGVFLFATQGSATLNISIARWSGNNTSGQWVTQSQAPGTNYDAATNANATFAEAAINLTAFGIQRSCPGFGAAWLRTISSHVVTSAEIKDRTDTHPINLSNCGTKTWSFTFDPKPISGTKLFAVYTLPGNVTRSIELTDPDNDGTYTASDNEIPAGTLTSTFQLRSNLDGDPDFENVVWQSAQDIDVFAPDQTINNSGSLQYEVLLSPPPQENFAGRDHVVTATVREVGTNTPLVGIPVSFGAENGTPPSCGTFDAATSITDTNGEATSTLSSATGCTTDIRAWVDGVSGTAGFQSGEATATTSKTFVVYSLVVSPPPAVNVVGAPHTFTVTLFRDTGAGPVGYAGQTLDLTLSGTSGAQFVSVNGSPASGTSAQCTTDTNGSCTIFITSSTTGSITFDASYTTQNDSGQGTFTSSGSKTYVDYRVSVTPASATNEVGTPHTFTVLVSKDEGAGFQPLAGEDVDLSLAPGTSNAHLVSINSDPASGTSGACVTKADGTCSVVIVATTPGTATLTADIDVVLDSGSLHREGTGDKLYSDFRMGITPTSAINEVGEPHTFTLTLERNNGSGWFGLVGETVALSLDPDGTDAAFTAVNGERASGVASSCITQAAAGTCEIVITSTKPGTVVLSAGWEGGNLSVGTASRNASATKVYVLATNAKTSCPSQNDVVPPGAIITYTLQATTDGTDLHNATLVDELPAHVEFLGSTGGGVHSGEASGGTVTWDLGTVSDGSELTYGVSGRIASGTPLGTNVINASVFDADEIAPKHATSSVVVSTGGVSASGRAYGVRASLLGGTVAQPATPDTTSGPGELGGLHDLAPGLDVGLIQIDNTPTIGATSAADRAVATTANVSIEVGGHTIRARSVRAESASTATPFSATSSRDGSLIQDFSIDGDKPVDVSSPKTITLTDPLGTKVADVYLLETTGFDAADGVHQPAGGLFASGSIVSGIRVVAHDLAATPVNESSEIVVSYADARVKFPSGLACGAGTPRVLGRGYVMNLDTGTGNSVLLGGVSLPSGGGSQDATVAKPDLEGVALLSSGTAHSEGGTNPLRSLTRARLEGADVLGSALTATLIEATSETTAGVATGTSVIADLIIAGTDVCATLEMEDRCRPTPDSVLLIDGGNVLVMLNEQISDAAGLTVNAVHVWIVGEGNSFGLPVGSEIVFGSALSGTTA